MFSQTKSSLYWAMLTAFGLGVGVAVSFIIYAWPEQTSARSEQLITPLADFSSDCWIRIEI